ncbi:hypothetical protein GGR57DRAFT_179352 [Xylariaceae sp. FL1272]|nr:hypothetical protein GGR57DRAFT_179352 [Xylariaceae sp. FL1272]
MSAATQLNVEAAVNAAQQNLEGGSTLVAAGLREVHVHHVHLNSTRTSSVPAIGALAGELAGALFDRNVELWQHWAIEVDGICIELSRRSDLEKYTKPKYYIRDYLTADEWRKGRSSDSEHLVISTVSRGYTRKSLQDIKIVAHRIWGEWQAEYGPNPYSLTSRNCQDFADQVLEEILEVNDDATSVATAQSTRFSEAFDEVGGDVGRFLGQAYDGARVRARRAKSIFEDFLLTPG